MTRHKRSKADLETELADQRAALSASSLGYDGGNLWEAKRICTVLYTLLHDGTGRTKSLLTQLGLRSRTKFVSTSTPMVSAEAPLGLVIWNVTQGTFVPVSSGMKEPNGIPPWGSEMSFQDWWEQPVFMEPSGKVLTRKNLVFAVRSQDGGSHFDESLPEGAYSTFRGYKGEDMIKRMKEFGGLDDKWRQEIDKHQTIANASLATIRQIAYEVQLSLAAMDQQRQTLTEHVPTI